MPRALIYAALLASLCVTVKGQAPAPGTVRVTVLDENGKPIEGAIVVHNELSTPLPNFGSVGLTARELAPLVVSVWTGQRHPVRRSRRSTESRPQNTTRAIDR